MVQWSATAFYYYIFTDMILDSLKDRPSGTIKKTVVAQNLQKLLPFRRSIFLCRLQENLAGVGEEMGSVKGTCLVVKRWVRNAVEEQRWQSKWQKSMWPEPNTQDEPFLPYQKGPLSSAKAGHSSYKSCLEYS